MKKIIVMLFAVVITSANMLAQEPRKNDHPKRTPEERAQVQLKKMTKDLALTADQQTKLKALFLKREQAKENKMKGHKDEREKMEADVQSILTPEQFQKFKTNREEMKKRREEHRPSPPAPATPPTPPSEPK